MRHDVSFGFTVQGLGELEQIASGIGDIATQAIAIELYQEGEEIMAASKPLVPVDLGTLRDSGTVLPPEIRGGSVSVTLGYGGAAESYALEQHENMALHHTTGQAKYLEQPANEHAGHIVDRISKNVGARLERLGHG